jgi:glycosyltransferase involved in cell wall biosynthesis
VFLDFLPKAQLGKIIRNSLFCAFLSDYEGFGLSILEAMSKGKPVITTEFGGPMDYCKNDENALLVDPKNIAEVAHALDRLWLSKSLRERLAKEAFESTIKYDWKSQITNYINFYKDLVC